MNIIDCMSTIENHSSFALTYKSIGSIALGWHSCAATIYLTLREDFIRSGQFCCNCYTKRTVQDPVLQRWQQSSEARIDQKAATMMSHPTKTYQQQYALPSYWFSQLKHDKKTDRHNLTQEPESRSLL